MALLHISEPGFSPNPHQRRVAVGIDLGTTHSLVAAVRHGVAECLPDEQGHVLLPSVVRYVGSGSRQIGQAAREHGVRDAANTIASVKRLMGRSLADVDAAHASAYQLEQPTGEGMVRVRTREGLKSPVEVSAEILATLRQRAEDTFDDDLYGAVITVPAYFDDAQRQATKDAAQLAGIKLLRLINEPTAAAIAYGLDNAAEGVYAVYDLGGGTFDISILRLQQGVFEVIATGGDSALGGDDWDAALAEAAHAHLQAAHPAVAALLLPASEPSGRAALLAAARACKQALTQHDAADFTLTLSATLEGDLPPTTAPGAKTPDTSFVGFEASWHITPLDGGGTRLALSVRRAEFEALTAPLLERTIAAVRRVLGDAQLAATDVQGVVLVGGSTRMPQVARAVGTLFGREPLANLNPDEIVALGAAIQANQLAGNAPARGADDLLLLDVIPLSLGIETMGGLVERIISRNETIPTARAQDFTTYQDGQTAMAIHVVQGERDLVADCRSLARFELRGIPPMAAGAARIRVTFTVDADGLLSVTAAEQTSGVEARVDVKPSYGLSDAQIAQMLQDSFATAAQDIAVRERTQARVDADRLRLATLSAMAADGDLLSAEEASHINTLLEQLAAIIAQADANAAQIEASAQTLAHATESFAARRMNRSIAQALAGRSVDTIG